MEEERVMIATKEEMAAHQVPLKNRDFCTHKWIPLNVCRKENFYAPWGCEHELHDFEICLYKDYEYRKRMKQFKVEAAQNK